MSLRLNVTTASGESASWQPAGETILQLQGVAGAEAQVRVQVHADAPWVTIATLRAVPAQPELCFVRLPKLPNLKVVVAKNTADQALKVWDSE
ncbi:MAG: hypothetical protein DI537_13975 [Stutzerimonas stutzeri]|nr:MAG: hypothetical protein DI537_13975 [Stutzerimonas stutzeri]